MGKAGLSVTGLLIGNTTFDKEKGRQERLETGAEWVQKVTIVCILLAWHGTYTGTNGNIYGNRFLAGFTSLLPMTSYCLRMTFSDVLERARTLWMRSSFCEAAMHQLALTAESTDWSVLRRAIHQKPGPLSVLTFGHGSSLKWRFQLWTELLQLHRKGSGFQ
jgi:hypothetical protein